MKERVLVVDRGTLLLKLYVYSVHVDRQKNRYENLQFDLEYMYGHVNEDYSDNIIGNIIERFLEKINLSMDRIIYILSKTDPSQVILTNSEYYSDVNIMNSNAKGVALSMKSTKDAQVKWEFDRYDSSTNFIKTAIHISSISVTDGILEMLRRFKIKTINIVDPALSLMTVVPRVGSYVVYDVGHEYLSTYFYDSGFISEKLEPVKIAGSLIDQDLSRDDFSKYEPEEFYEKKHKLGIAEISSLDGMFEKQFPTKVKEDIGRYCDSKKTELDGIIFIGGTSSLPLEEYIPDNYGKRIYIEGVKGYRNEFEIETYYKNFSVISTSALMYVYLHENLIDLSDRSSLIALTNKFLFRNRLLVDIVVSLVFVLVLCRLIVGMTYGKVVEEKVSKLNSDASTYTADTVMQKRDAIDALMMEVDSSLMNMDNKRSDIIKLYDVESRIGNLKPATIFIEEFYYYGDSRYTLKMLSLDGEDIRQFQRLLMEYVFSNITLSDSSVIEVGEVPVYTMTFTCKGIIVETAPSGSVSISDPYDYEYREGPSGEYYVEEYPVGVI